MGFFTIRLNVRVTENIAKMIEEIIKSDNEKYGDASDVIRVGIIRLHRSEVTKSRLKPEYKADSFIRADRAD